MKASTLKALRLPAGILLVFGILTTCSGIPKRSTRCPGSSGYLLDSPARLRATTPR